MFGNVWQTSTARRELHAPGPEGENELPAVTEAGGRLAGERRWTFQGTEQAEPARAASGSRRDYGSLFADPGK